MNMRWDFWNCLPSPLHHQNDTLLVCLSWHAPLVYRALQQGTGIFWCAHRILLWWHEQCSQVRMCVVTLHPSSQTEGFPCSEAWVRWVSPLQHFISSIENSNLLSVFLTSNSSWYISLHHLHRLNCTDWQNYVWTRKDAKTWIQDPHITNTCTNQTWENINFNHSCSTINLPYMLDKSYAFDLSQRNKDRAFDPHLNPQSCMPIRWSTQHIKILLNENLLQWTNSWSQLT